MIEREIIFARRGGGKTYKIMTEIHDLIRSGSRADVLVIFPTMSYLHWWTREWEERFPHVPMVAYTALTAMDRVRGRTFKNVYVEDIIMDDEGINSTKLTWLYPCLKGEGTITFTVRPIEINQRSHSESKTSKQAQRAALERMRQK